MKIKSLLLVGSFAYAACSSTLSGQTDSSYPIAKVPAFPRAVRLRLDATPSGFRVLTFPIAAGQRLEMTNARYGYIQVQSDFPVAFRVGDCHFTDSEIMHCNNVSFSDLIVVQDLRIPKAGEALPSNKIRVTAIEHQ